MPISSQTASAKAASASAKELRDPTSFTFATQRYVEADPKIAKMIEDGVGSRWHAVKRDEANKPRLDTTAAGASKLRSAFLADPLGGEMADWEPAKFRRTTTQDVA